MVERIILKDLKDNGFITEEEFYKAIEYIEKNTNKRYTNNNMLN